MINALIELFYDACLNYARNISFKISRTKRLGYERTRYHFPRQVLSYIQTTNSPRKIVGAACVDHDVMSELGRSLRCGGGRWGSGGVGEGGGGGEGQPADGGYSISGSKCVWLCLPLAHVANRSSSEVLIPPFVFESSSDFEFFCESQ